jgi:hypothetical protein
MSANDNNAGGEKPKRIQDFTPEDWKRFHEEGRQDWEFIRGAIERALVAGHPLDQAWVEQTTKGRLEFATSHYSYPNGAVPTLESSKAIVKSTLDLHLIGVGLA